MGATEAGRLAQHQGVVLCHREGSDDRAGPARDLGAKAVGHGDGYRVSCTSIAIEVSMKWRTLATQSSPALSLAVSRVDAKLKMRLFLIE